MGDENPICTLGDYSKPSHKGYRNTIELPVGNNMVPLRSIPFGKERACVYFNFPFCGQATNWLERLPAGSITIWEDLTTRFLAQFFPPRRTAKLHNDILMFQQHHGESLSEAWTRFKDLLQKVPHHGIDLWLQVQIFYDHVNPVTRRTIDQLAGGKLHDRNAKESWALLEDLALYENESWNDPRDFAKPVKEITLPQNFPKIVNQAWVKHSNDLLHLRNPAALDMKILVKTCLMPLALKTQNDSFAFVHELKQEMHADLKYIESLEYEHEELESDKAEFSNMYDMLLQECVSKDVMCSYLQSSSDLDEITELQCLYLHKVRECDCLAQKLSEQTEFVSKEIYTELLQSFAKLEKHSISLEIALQECQEQLKNDTVCKEKASNVFRKEREQYFEIQDLKAQLQDKNIAISELKKLIEKCKGKSVDTKFDKPSVVRQPNAQRIPKPSVLGKPAPFSDSLERKYFAKKKSVLKTNESEGLSKPVTPQNLPQTAKQAVRNTNVIKPGMYRIASSTTQTRAPQLNQTSRNTNPRVSTSTGVAHKTNVSRPQPRSNQMKDKVVPNTSHVKFKKTEVEEHPRISSISNQTKSVTACNDSLNSRTSNVNAVCATCGKCVFNSNHDACVSKFLKDVNARTKKPNVVPISTRKPKSQANKSVATPHKKTVASESTITNSKSYYRMLYKKTNKAWKWWIAQQCPSAYTWVPKTKRKWVPKVRNESVTKKIVQLILFIVDSGCTKHMTSNLSLLCNFVEKYLGTVRFGNDQFAPILGYRDLVQGNITIKRVYYVEGLNHNLFSVGQFCDADLKDAFRKSTCFVRDLQGNDLLTGNRGTDLYTISLQETTSSTPICLMAKASPTQAWLWHQRLSHLNFDYINLLSKKDVVIGLPKLKYVKDQLRVKMNTPEVLERLSHDDPKEILPQAQVISVRTDRGTESLKKTLNASLREGI
ncbi:retrovirus-related pol polyprotein from transposon TNT 1-94 [Tanacetum coccineum]